MGLDGVGAKPSTVSTSEPSNGGTAAAEPIAPVFEPKPFKLNWGRLAIGGAIGGALGGALGAVALGHAMGAGGGYHDGGLGGILIAIGLVALTGLAIGASVAYATQKSDHSNGEVRRQDNEVGQPIGSLASELLQQFDHNHNSNIDLINTTGLPSADERARIETRTQSEGEWTYDWWDDDWDHHTRRWTEQRGISAVDVWGVANTNGDDKVELGEIKALMATFDTNGDGSLTTAERSTYDAAHKLIIEQWRPT